ncbi:type B 50S ribosomal protein L31 [Streptomyces sp. NPDC090075]|uniref:type B 50S ribosomal protein L31 n=1 Tax=Streptomyces sp. NPDC090075 TaxID=3365937 RepID=UPI00380A111E
MKPRIHPDSRLVVFRDRAADATFLTRSTADSSRTIVWEDGNTYPLVDVEISSASHPFYTGKARVLDSAGRVELFERRYGRTAAARG